MRNMAGNMMASIMLQSSLDVEVVPGPAGYEKKYTTVYYWGCKYDKNNTRITPPYHHYTDTSLKGSCMCYWFNALLYSD